ncbi:pyridoxine-5'-phosphate oxidase-like [Saccostrea echinata]|uniref:pyridoxine-5'-phosphate oxidase-like n=1 Tax=Saccostrea echinata TaxID=191078 RepID=UPI002A823BCE|nr:pyridoxine-5'-phosphate oxidase-like [Saccostrea echinata]
MLRFAVRCVVLRCPSVVMSSAKYSDVAEMRTPYRSSNDIFDVNNLVSKNPIKQFEAWFNEAKDVPHVGEANAMALATATKSGIPSVRMVLMKGYSEEGFTFYTNYESRKAGELEENPVCSLMFYWDPLKRSVRVEGTVEKVSEEESLNYFEQRPRQSRLGAIVSHQGTILENREVINKKYEELLEEYKDQEKNIPKPSYWGGYIVRPTIMEFWQGQTNRLHDRIRFRKLKNNETIDSKYTHQGEDDWVFERLAP